MSVSRRVVWILTYVMMIPLLSDVTLRHWVISCRRFEGTCCTFVCVDFREEFRLETLDP